MEDIYDFEMIVRGVTRKDGSKRLVVWSRRQRQVAHPVHVQELATGAATPSQLLDTCAAVSDVLTSHVSEVYGVQGVFLGEAP